MKHKTLRSQALILATLLLTGGCNPRCTGTTSPPTPIKQVTIWTSVSAPPKTKEHILKWHNIREALTSAHNSIGSDPENVKDKVTELTNIAAKTEFKDVVASYVKLARLSNDTHFRPKQYVIKELDKDTEADSRSARLNAELGKNGVNVTASGGVDSTTTEESLVERILQYNQPVLITHDAHRLIQNQERTLYDRIINTMAEAGYPNYRVVDLVGKWSWDWREGGEEKGTITFYLERDLTFDAHFQPTTFGPGSVVSWGTGKWNCDDQRLVITMYRVGVIRDVWIRDHKVEWINENVKSFSPGNQILLEDDDELLYQVDKK